uniref:Peptidase M12A domain-containing protein n=2 Tax=Graphocephala atropunctata TaxID=36148 RepID=A0A1B6M763_9HEMI
MMHTMGMEHQHQRPDRDCFVYVAKKLGNSPGSFGILSGYEYLSGFPYDYDSVMQYRGFRNVLYSHNNRSRTLGRYDGTISRLDVHLMGSLYCGRKSYCEEHNSCASFYDYANTNPLCWRIGPEYSNDKNP